MNHTRPAPRDPGYGSGLAPIGTEEWAKRWRLEFQSVVKDLPETPSTCLRFHEVGLRYRAWTLLTDENGNYFRTWDAFCFYHQPWGLGMDPEQFKAFVLALKADQGPKAAELEMVAPGEDKGGAPKGNQNAKKEKDEGETTGDTMSPVVSGPDERNAKRLRAILRAPEVVQDLYKKDRIRQTDAAKLGPKSPTPEQAAKIAEARQRLEKLDLAQDAAKARKVAGEIVRKTLDVPSPRSARERLLEGIHSAASQGRLDRDDLVAIRGAIEGLLKRIPRDGSE